MNVIARHAGFRHAAIETEIAGERAVLDNAGVLWLPGHGVMVVSDLHLEKGACHARRRGTMIPPYDSAATLSRLGAAAARHRPRAVVCLGDSFHDGDAAGLMPARYRDMLLELMAGRDWFWVAGNHDPLPPRDLPGRTVTAIALGALTFRHEPTAGSADGEVAGHLHPGARIVRRGRSVRRPCFAGDGRRLVMPAFGSFTGALNVLDRAYRGIFRREELTAYLLGPERIYAISGTGLSPG